MISLKKHAVQMLLLTIIGLLLWGCGGSATPLLNGEPQAELSGLVDSVKTFSLDIPENTSGLRIVLSGSPDAKLELFDPADNSLLICKADVSCALLNPLAGKYELKLTATSEYENVAIVAAWGAPEASTLSAGGSYFELNIPAGGVHLASFHLAEDVDSFYLVAGQSSVVSIYNASGTLLPPVKLHESMEPGAYFIELPDISADTDNPLGYAIAFGGEVNASLERGLPKATPMHTDSRVDLETFYLPEGVDTVMVLPSRDPVRSVIYSAAGDGASSYICNPDYPCTLQNPTAGTYYVETWYDPIYSFEVDDNYAVTMQYAGPGELSSMQNGDYVTAEAPAADQYWIQSFYIEEDNQPFAFMNSDNLTGRMFTSNGQASWIPDTSIMYYFFSAGSYFVAMDTKDYCCYGNNTFDDMGAAKVLWGNTHTMNNGDSVPIGDKYLVLESIKVDIGDWDWSNGPPYAGLVTATVHTDKVHVDHPDAINGCAITMDTCAFYMPYSGIYYVRAQTPNFEGREFIGMGAISLAWGPTETSLENGAIETTLPSKYFIYSVQSLYLDQETTVTVNTSKGAYVYFFNGYLDNGSTQHSIGNCYTTSPCSWTLPAGLSYIYLQFSGLSEGETFQVTW